MAKKTKKTTSDIVPQKPEMGRPSEFKPEYCEMLIEHMSKGLSFEAFAGVIGVCKKTLYNWADTIPQFLHAKERAYGKCMLWWEQAGIDGLWTMSERSGKDSYSSKSLNSTVWALNMKNRFKWRDKHEDEEVKTVLQPIIVEAPMSGKSFEVKLKEEK